jgi:hypothetical protein
VALAVVARAAAARATGVEARATVVEAKVTVVEATENLEWARPAGHNWRSAQS